MQDLSLIRLEKGLSICSMRRTKIVLKNAALNANLDERISGVAYTDNKGENCGECCYPQNRTAARPGLSEIQYYPPSEALQCATDNHSFWIYESGRPAGHLQVQVETEYVILSYFLTFIVADMCNYDLLRGFSTMCALVSAQDKAVNGFIDINDKLVQEISLYNFIVRTDPRRTFSRTEMH